MKIFEGKSPTERNKIIAAMVLGAMALLALTYTFGGMFFGGKKTGVTVSVSPTATASPNANTTQISNLPTQAEIDSEYAVIPVAYNPNSFYAPDAGRNIFAFYEPPPPTPFSPTPLPTEKPYVEPTQIPTPTPPQMISFVSPQSVYAGSKTFLLEVNGDKFTPDTRIIFNGNELPTTYVNPQRLTANVPTNFFAGEGQKFVMTRSVDGKLYSNQVSINVQAAPTPQFQFVGASVKQRENNSKAWFREQGKPLEFSHRLNDLIGERFRLISISPSEVVVQDTRLEFKYRLPLLRTSTGQTNNSRTENITSPNIINPNFPTYPVYNNTEIPGIPNNIPRYNPSNTNMVPPLQQQQPKQKTQSDDDDDDGDN